MDNTNYIQFWSIFIKSNLYKKMRFTSQNNLPFNVIFSEFIAHLNTAKITTDKTPEFDDIQKSLDIILLSLELTELEMEELNSLLQESGLSPFIYSRNNDYISTHSYDYETNSIIVPQPHLSWTLDENKVWQPPIPCPGSPYSFWDEEKYQADNTTGWVLVTP